MIPKRLIFIWLGGGLPDYGKFCIESFKKVNSSFEIMLVNEPDMENVKSQDLKECIALIKSDKPNIYKHMTTRRWAKIHLSSTVGKLTALSDAFRFYLLNKYGGIYLDLDTFPIKPFDDELIDLKNGFVVNYKPKRYDIFFIGMPMNCVDNGLIHIPGKQNKKWFSRCVDVLTYYEKLYQKIYIHRFSEKKHLFFKKTLQYGESAYPRQLVPRYYVDHFRNEQWKKDAEDKGAVNIYYWNRRKNFGDSIAPYIITALSGKDCINVKSAATNKIVSIGSILDHNEISYNDIVWGSGMRKDGKIYPKNLDVRLVRGPLTRYVLLKNGINAPAKYCDPGVLAPFCYNINRDQGIVRDMLVLLHFDDDKCKIDSYLKRLGIYCMSMDTGNEESILNEIARSKYIASSSLHGIIAAEALGKPAVLLRGGGNHEPMFKYIDYYLGSGRTEADIKTTTLGDIESSASAIQFTKPAKFDLQSLIETFPLKLKDGSILGKVLKYYSTNQEDR